MRDFLIKHKIALLVGGFALVIRLCFVFGYSLWYEPVEFRAAFAPGSDSKRYVLLGHNLVTQGLYSPSVSSPYEPEQTIEPMYPFFLAGVFSIKESLLLVAGLQILFAAATAVIIYKIAALILPSSASIAAGLLFAFDPVSIYLAGAIFTETLFIFLFLAGIYFFLKGAAADTALKGKALFFGGLLIGMSALTRPEVQFLPALFVLVYLWMRRGDGTWGMLKMSGVFLAGFLLVVSPWLVRNKLIYGSWQTSSIGIHKVYLFDLLYFYSHEENVSFKEARAALRERVVAISPYGNDDPTFANAPYLQKVTLDYIKERPVSFAVFYSIKTLPFFLSDGLRYLASKFAVADAPVINISGYVLEGEFGELLRVLRTENMLPLLFLGVGGACWFVVTIGMFMGIWFAIKQKAPKVLGPVLLLAALVLIFAFMSGPVSNPRLRFKAAPMMFVLAVFGLSQFFHARFNRPHTLPDILQNDKGKEYRVSDEQPRG